MGKYVYGPILSRRYGWSLGIDIMPKLKTCTFNCVYCELGRTSLNGFVAKSYRCGVPANFEEDFTNELREKLIEHSYINAITFGYNGEPTLNEKLDFIHELTRKTRYEVGLEKKVPISILTNSSTLEYAGIRKALGNFDIVIAKLDAGDQKMFKNTNLPHYTVPPIEEIVKNLRKLKSEMKKDNKLYIQTMLYNVRAPSSIMSNARGDNVVGIANGINQIQPDQVQIYSVSREPAEPSVIKLTKLELIELSDLMASNCKTTDIYYFP